MVAFVQGPWSAIAVTSACQHAATWLVRSANVLHPHHDLQRKDARPLVASLLCTLHTGKGVGPAGQKPWPITRHCHKMAQHRLHCKSWHQIKGRWCIGACGDEFQLGPIAVLSACCCTADVLCCHRYCTVLCMPARYLPCAHFGVSPLSLALILSSSCPKSFSCGRHMCRRLRVSPQCANNSERHALKYVRQLLPTGMHHAECLIPPKGFAGLITSQS